MFLIHTQVKVVRVEQELWEIKELRNQLFDIGHVVFGCRKPGFTDAMEHPVCQVKVTALDDDRGVD